METVTSRGVRKKREGIVVSDAMDKTIVIRIERRVRHPVYGKELTRFTKLHVHDEKNEAHVGDLVRVVETRPVSRLKRWRLEEVLRRAKGVPPGSSDDSAENKS